MLITQGIEEMSYTFQILSMFLLANIIVNHLVFVC